MADNINQTLEDLRQALLLSIQKEGQCCQPKGSKVGAEPSTQAPEYGETDDEYQTSEQFFSARCNACNAIYDTILGLSDWLDDNHIDLKAGAFGALTSGLVFALVISGPAGWAIAVSGAVTTALLTWIITESLDFEDLSLALDDVHSELVGALYNASDTSSARTNFIAVLTGASPSLPAPLLFFTETALGEDLLNNVLEPRSDMATYQSPDPIDCGNTILLWDFDSDAEGWTFRDDSTANASAVGSYDGSEEALSHAQIIVAGGKHRISQAVDISPTLAQAVLPGNSIQADHDAVSDGVVVFRILKVIYDDTSEYSYNKGAHTSAGTIILPITVGGTVETIELLTGRSNGSGTQGYTFTTKTLEVRIQS